MTLFSRAALLAVGLFASFSVFALSLDAAKQQGLVGEQPSGYLAVVGKASPEADALVADINQKRRAAYENIAKRNGTELSAVEQLAGKKAIEQTPPGQFVKLPSGAWQQVK